MTSRTPSTIVSSTIDADYPVAGQDNDSQGFRDNFSVIKDGLATAAGEISDLKTKTARLDEDNDFNGNVLDNAQTNRLYGTVYGGLGNITTPTKNVSLNDGEYQRITVVGNHTINFTDWPETGLYAKVRLELISDGTSRTVTFSTQSPGIPRFEVSQDLAQATGAARLQSTGTTTTTKFSFPTANLTTGTFEVGNTLYGTGLSGTVTISDIDNISTTVTQTQSAFTVTYTAISNVGVVTTSTSTSGLANGAKVKLSDVSGMTGIAANTEYYIFDVDVSSFALASTYQNAIDGNALTGISGNFAGTATGTFEELNPNSNRVSVGASAGMYVGMPIKFSGTSGGGIVSGTDYIVAEVIDSTGIRLKDLSGNIVTLTPGTPSLSVVARTVFTTSFSSQAVTNVDGLTLTTAASLFPTPFIVSSDSSRVRVVEAWTANGGNDVYFKYVGEFA